MYRRQNLFYETEGISTLDHWIFEYFFDFIWFLYKTTTSRFQTILVVMESFLVWRKYNSLVTNLTNLNAAVSHSLATQLLGVALQNQTASKIFPQRVFSQQVYQLATCLTSLYLHRGAFSVLIALLEHFHWLLLISFLISCQSYHL